MVRIDKVRQVKIRLGMVGSGQDTFWLQTVVLIGLG
jgi:hypothetical protein